MNKYKFRVFDKKNNKYCDNNQDNAGLPHNQIYFDTKEKGNFVILPRENRVLEQFTELIDANGREVYEGDRVKVWLNPEYKLNYNNYPIKKYKDIFEGIVKYLHGSYHVFGENDEWVTLSNFWVSGDFNKIEIIGNIHE